VIHLDLGASLHFLSALLVNVCDGNIRCNRGKVVLVGVDFDSSCRVRKFDVAEKEDLRSASFLDIEVFAAPVGEKECCADKESGECESTEFISPMCRFVHVNEVLGSDGLLSLNRWVDVLPCL
jgi:hypothetical protein